jgi:hypothetical protein
MNIGVDFCWDKKDAVIALTYAAAKLQVRDFP